MRILPLLVLVACSSTPADPNAPGSSKTDAALTVPPGPTTVATLSALAERGDVASEWKRLEYLIDLFDGLRFAPGSPGRDVLAEALAIEGSPSGEAGTDVVVERLSGLAHDLRERDRLHSGAQNALVLLEHDRAPPARDKVYQRMVELKTIARGGGPLAANARLRLAAYCLVALQDAERAPRRQQPLIASHCLYPLYDADPAPYFEPDPAARPPAPSWNDLVAEAAAMLDGIDSKRHHQAARGLGNAFDSLAQSLPETMPARPDPRTEGLLNVPHAPPYDGAPLVEIPADDERTADAIADALRIPVSGDGRGIVAVQAPPERAADALLRVAEGAALAGAARLELLVSTTQVLAVPPGDYWKERISDRSVPRLAVIPLSLAPFGADERADPSRDTALAHSWSPSSAQLGLALVIEPGRWTLTSPTGTVARLTADSTGQDPTRELLAQLERVRAAFPDEDGLILVPAGGATVGALIGVAGSIVSAARERAILSRLALGSEAPRTVKKTLAARIERRARATVAIDPPTLAERASVALRCYQQALEKSPRLSGAVRVELSGEEVVTDRAPAALKACALEAVGAAMQKATIRAADVAFSLTDSE